MSGSRTSKRRRSSYTAGEKGVNRVRLHPHPRDGTLLLEFRGDDGRRQNRSLRHRDFERGKQAADELAAALRKHEGPRTEELTLRKLFDKYEREVTVEKTAAKQRHDRAARALFETCWGGGTLVADLDKTKWDRFVRQRKDGRLKPPGRKAKGGVRNRMIQYDLKLLMAVFNWAVEVVENRRPLVDRNPFRNCEMPKEESPRRPRMSDAEYETLRTAAQGLPPQIALFLYLCHESGHRSKSVSRLRWNDIDLADGSIIWRGEHDKLLREHRTPLTQEQTTALKQIRHDSASISDGWVFPSPDDANQPISRREIVRWWARLEAAASLRRVTGRGWHSLRRKFAGDNDELPPAQLMALGGWKSYKTVVEIYQAPDVEKLRNVLERRSELRKLSQAAATTTTNDNQQNARVGGALLEAVAVN